MADDQASGAAREVRVSYEYVRFQQDRWITLVGRLAFQIAELTKDLKLRGPDKYGLMPVLVATLDDGACWVRDRAMEADQTGRNVSDLLARILAWYESTEETTERLLATVEADASAVP